METAKARVMNQPATPIPGSLRITTASAKDNQSNRTGLYLRWEKSCGKKQLLNSGRGR